MLRSFDRGLLDNTVVTDKVIQRSDFIHIKQNKGKIRCWIYSITFKCDRNNLPVMLDPIEIKNVNAKIERDMANLPSSG